MTSHGSTTEDIPLMEEFTIDLDAIMDQASEEISDDILAALPPSLGEAMEQVVSLESLSDDGQDDPMMIEVVDLLLQDSLTEIGNIEPSNDDVTFGKGGTRTRPGNIKFREDCLRLAPPFLENPTAKIKEEVARQVVAAVLARGGRFLEENHNRNDQGRWKFAAFDTALQKTIYCLADIKKKFDFEKLNGVLNEARSLGLGYILNVVAWLNPSKIERPLMPADDTALESLCNLNLLSKYPGADQEAAGYFIPKRFRVVVQKSRGSPAPAMAAIRSNGLDKFSRQDNGTWGPALQMLPHVNILRACNQRRDKLLNDDDKLALAELLVKSGHVAMWALRNYVLARTNYEASLDIFKSVFTSQQDPNNIRIATTLKDLGRLCQEMGDYPSALSKYTQALGMMRASDTDASNLDLAKTLHFVGRVCFCLGKRPEATQHFEAALEMKHKVHASAGSKALTMANICRILQVDGRLKEALTMYKSIEQMHGVNYRSTFGATTRICEGQIHQDLGDLSKARRKYEKALEIYDQVFGIQARNDATAMAHSYLGSVQLDMGDLDAAHRHLNLALDIMKEVFGATAKHDNIANVTYHLGRLYKKRGDLQNAQRYYRESRAMMIELHGGEDSHQPTTVEEYIRRSQENRHFH